MENKMPIEKVLEEVAKDLGTIEIPVNYMEKIGVPVSRAITNINACVQAIYEVQAKAAAEAEAEHEIDLTEEAEDGREDHAE